MLQSEQDRWREQWSHFDPSPEIERLLLEKWLWPMTLDEVRGLDVLDAGCGNGVHSAILAQAGARSVTGLDYASWREAQQRFRHLSNLDFGLHDLDAGPPSGSYDLVVCIGVLPHVRDPASAVQYLASAVRPAGRLVIWATVREGNAGLMLFDLAKQGLTSWAGLATKERAAMAIAMASRPAQVLAVRSSLARRVLPYGRYLAEIGELPLARVKQNFYDALNAPRRVFFKSAQVSGWMRAAGLDVSMTVSKDGKSRTWIGRRSQAR